MQAHLCCVAPAAGSPRALCAAPPKRVPRARLQCQAAAEPASQPQQQTNQKLAQPSQASPLSLPPPRLALKEWAVSCQALAGGAQTLLFRKGGVREPTFKPRATYFALFPTSFHSDAQLLAPGVADAYAEVRSQVCCWDGGSSSSKNGIHSSRVKLLRGYMNLATRKRCRTYLSSSCSVHRPCVARVGHHAYHGCPEALLHITPPGRSPCHNRRCRWSRANSQQCRCLHLHLSLARGLRVMQLACWRRPGRCTCMDQASWTLD